MSIDRVYEYLHNAHLFYIATCEDDQPRVRPFGFVMKFHDKLWFSIMEGKPVYEQMLKNPKVEMCIIGKGEGGTWLRLAGTAVFDEVEEQEAFTARDEARKADEGKGPDLKKIYKDGAPKNHLFYLKDCDARVYAHGQGVVEEYHF